MPDGRKLPYGVEDEVTAAGANWDAELDAGVSATADGDLVTTRGPESSAAAARTLLADVGGEGPGTEAEGSGPSVDSTRPCRR